jgi:hypothetical protein
MIPAGEKSTRVSLHIFALKHQFTNGFYLDRFNPKKRSTFHNSHFFCFVSSIKNVHLCVPVVFVLQP